MSNQAIGDRAEKQRAQREAREAKDKEVKELKSKVSFSNLLEGKLEKLKGKSDKVKARVIAEIFANASGRVDTADGVFDVLPGVGVAGIVTKSGIGALSRSFAGRAGEKIEGFLISDLIKSGQLVDPSDKLGKLTYAGRAIAKHNPASRKGSAFPQVGGAPSRVNQIGQNELENLVLDSSRSIKSSNRFGGFDIHSAGGKGVRFDGNGQFRGFLEP